MPLETVTYISDLVAGNPTGADDRSQGDDHIRNIKSALLATFPNITGEVTLTHTQINNLGGAGGGTDALTWDGAAKHVGTTDPTSGVGEDGDIYFVRES